MKNHKEYQALYQAGVRDGYKNIEPKVPPVNFIKGLLKGSKYMEWREVVYKKGIYQGRKDKKLELERAKGLKQNEVTKEMVFRIHYQSAYSQTLIGNDVVTPKQSMYEVVELKRAHLQAIQKGIKQAQIDRQRISGIDQHNTQEITRSFDT